MTESSASPSPENFRKQLLELHRALLHLHKALLDAERKSYEELNGPLTAGELLQLVINHEFFAWLREISQLIVRIDELSDAKDPPATAADAKALIERVRSLLMPGSASGGLSSTGGNEAFNLRYESLLTRDPASMTAKQEVEQLLIRLA